MKYNRIGFALLFYLLFITVQLFVITDSFAVERLNQTLPNGLKVIHVQRHNLPIVAATLIIKGSQLDEPTEKAGVAYLTSRMLTEGTFKRNSSNISEEIDFIGASLDASANSDYTAISLSVLKKDIEKGFDLFSDILLNPSFPEAELKRVKELTKGRLKRREEGPSFIAEKRFMTEVFGSHPYGRLVEGGIEGIDKIGREDVVNFYKENYMPQAATLVVVGDIKKDELDIILKKYLAEWKGDPSRSAGSNRWKGSYPDKQKRFLIHKDITQANIIFGHIGISRDNPDYYAVSVMNYILGGGGFASRLMKGVRDEMGLAYSIYSHFSSNKERGQFEVTVQTKNESADVVIKEILKHVKKIMTEPVSDEELEDAKRYLIGSFPRRLETSRKIADFLAAVEFYNLGDDYIKRYPDYINSVKKDDVMRAAKKYLKTESYVLVIVGNKEKIKSTELQPLEYVH
ncbi:MAG: insulinase family protein [Nitrospirae bacterium]|nr:insulinase family protein [Nitrospirota bacterium]